MEKKKKKVICALCEDGISAERIVTKWFAKFKSENFFQECNLKKKNERAVRSFNIDDEQIKRTIENNQYYTIREIIFEARAHSRIFNTIDVGSILYVCVCV